MKIKKTNRLYNISCEEAREAVELLSTSFKFVISVLNTSHTVRMGSVVQSIEPEFITELMWPNDKHLYVERHCPSEDDYMKIRCVTKDEDAAFPEILMFLSGAKLCSWNQHSHEHAGYKVECQIPEFSSLSELKMKLAVLGLS